MKDNYIKIEYTINNEKFNSKDMLRHLYLDLSNEDKTCKDLSFSELILEVYWDICKENEFEDKLKDTDISIHNIEIVDAKGLKLDKSILE